MSPFVRRTADTLSAAIRALYIKSTLLPVWSAIARFRTTETLKKICNSFQNFVLHFLFSRTVTNNGYQGTLHNPNTVRNSGMTLIQLLILAAILIVVFALSFPPWREYQRVSQADTDVENIAIAIKKYYKHTQRYPITFDELITNSGVDGWRGNYLESIPQTPWGGTYVLQTNAYKVGIPKDHPRVPPKYRLGGISEISRVYHVDARIGEKYWW